MEVGVINSRISKVLEWIFDRGRSSDIRFFSLSGKGSICLEMGRVLCASSSLVSPMVTFPSSNARSNKLLIEIWSRAYRVGFQNV